jgi:hypothetical protein
MLSDSAGCGEKRVINGEPGSLATSRCERHVGRERAARGRVSHLEQNARSTGFDYIPTSKLGARAASKFHRYTRRPFQHRYSTGLKP